jgi:hypothetical protein
VKKLLSTAVVVIVCFVASAQEPGGKAKNKDEERREKINALKKQAEEGVLIFSKQNIFGLQLRSNGYGIFYELGKMKTNRKTNLYRIDITEIKHHKEEKIPPGVLFSATLISMGRPIIFTSSHWALASSIYLVKREIRMGWPYP